jgi:glutamine cyclotransferase
MIQTVTSLLSVMVRNFLHICIACEIFEFRGDRSSLKIHTSCSLGSKYLHFWNPDTMEFIRKVPVTRLDGSEASDINELEYWRGRVIANVWYRDFLLVINPATGKVEKEYGRSPSCSFNSHIACSFISHLTL